MSIQKKSLISTLKSAKKANVVKEEVTVSAATASPVKMAPRMMNARKSPRAAALRRATRKTLRKMD